MTEHEHSQRPIRRVLIASANPLFAQGLQRMVLQRWEGRGAEIRLAASMADAADALDTWRPDLVIVDYDDARRPGGIQREAFLSHFIAGDRPMQVMLVSLRESGEVVVYDRRSLTPDQAEDWLDLPWIASPAEFEPAEAPVTAPGAKDYSAGGPPAHFIHPTTQRSDGMKHYVIAGILTVILTVVTYLVLQAVGLLPVQASTQAGPVDRMVELQLWMISFLFSLIISFMGYSVVVFRRRKGETGEGKFFKGSTGLEVLWTLFPLATVIYLSFLGAQALGEVRKVDRDAMVINVIAFQWGWIFEYPDHGIQTNELWMPVDRQAQLMLTSRDVIHSFWVPEFRVKQDALPGENLVKELRITPTKLGDYTVMCAELCGGAHAYMNAPVHVVSQADFDTWVGEQTNAANLSPADRGAKLAQAQGCLACHSVDGAQMTGPTWKGLAGAQVTLTDGSTVTADDQYLHEAIVNPNTQVHQGFAPIMPATYKDTLSDEQVTDLIEFIKTLK